MSDKLRKLYPLAAVFTPGELPSASKLTGISTQSSGAFSLVEKAIGDLWNEAGDPVLSPSSDINKNALQIPNIGRTIGQLHLLNSLTPGQGPLSGSMVYTDNVGNLYNGLTVAYLRYLPTSLPSSGNMILGNTFSPLVQGQFKTLPELITVTGDWCVTSAGKLYTFDPIPAGMTLAYVPTLVADKKNSAGTSSAAWNVIPDPNRSVAPYNGVKISFANGTDNTNGYHIWLPPRLPLTGTKVINMMGDPSVDNIQTLPDSGTIRMWQAEASDASLANGVHYRYNLPDEVTGEAVNTQLPTGFIYLWDQQTGTKIDGVTYYTPANLGHIKFKFRITGVDLGNVLGTTVGNGIITSDSTQLPTDYMSRFKVITVGASLAKSLSSLHKDFWNHTHKNTDGFKPISHKDLDNLVTPPGSANYPSLADAPAFGFSRWLNDDHTQYLHRGGSTRNTATQRDMYDNAIWNKLIVANSVNPSIAIQLAGTLLGAVLMPVDPSVDLFIQNSDSYILFKGNSIPALAGLTLGSITGNTVVRIQNGLVDKLYFGNVLAPPNDYMTFDEATNLFSLIADGSVDTSTLQVGYAKGIRTYFKSYEAQAVYDEGEGSWLPGRYQYSVVGAEPGKEQFYFIAPHDFSPAMKHDFQFALNWPNNPSLTYESGLATLIIDEMYLSNPSTGTAFIPEAYHTLRLPHGAIIQPAQSQLTAYFIANASASRPTVQPKHVVSLDISFAPIGTSTFSAVFTSLLKVSDTNGVAGNITMTATYSAVSPHVIDNKNNYYRVTVNVPANNGNIGVASFLGAKLNYYMTEVNN